MKKLTKLFVLSTSMLAMYATANESAFTGFYLGEELQATKHRFSIPLSELGWEDNDVGTAKSKFNPGIAIVTGYGFDYGYDFVGLLEGKLKFSNTKTKDEEGLDLTVTKSSYGADISYLQGYRIDNSFLPYIKLGISTLNYKINDDLLNHTRVKKQRDGIAVGFNYGVGMKFSINQNLVTGVEFSKENLKDSNRIKYKTNTIGINLSYFF